jgi:hypothetical protein
MEKGGKQNGKSDKIITESKARQKEALYCAQTYQIKIRKVLGNAEKSNTWRRQAALHAPVKEARERLRPMARVKSARAEEGIPTEDEIVSTLSAAADRPRKTLSA